MQTRKPQKCSDFCLLYSLVERTITSARNLILFPSISFFFIFLLPSFFLFILFLSFFLREISDPIRNQIQLHRKTQNVHSGKLLHFSAVQLHQLLLDFVVPYKILLQNYRNMLNISKEPISISIFAQLLLLIFLGINTIDLKINFFLIQLNEFWNCQAIRQEVYWKKDQFYFCTYIEIRKPVTELLAWVRIFLRIFLQVRVSNAYRKKKGRKKI